MKVLLIVLGLAGSLWWALGSTGGNHAWERGDVQVSYYGNGQTRARLCYADGQPHGPAEEWYPDGSPAARGRYEDGLRSGEWTFWLEGGTIDRERTGLYERGRRIGPAGDDATHASAAPRRPAQDRAAQDSAAQDRADS